MPFATEPRPRVSSTGLACRAIVAARLQAPELELPTFRALQFAWFTTPLVPDDRDDLALALERVEGLDVPAVLAALDSPRSKAPTRPTAPRRAPPPARPPRRRARPPRPTAPCAIPRPR